MSNPTTAPLDLGRLAALDDRRLEAGVILWDRFCIVGEPRELAGSRIVTVTDLERKLGEPREQHRLELHLLPVPPAREASVRRALTLEHGAQPRVQATGRAGELLVLACEPARGEPLGLQPSLPLPQLLGLGLQLASSLAELHALELHDIRFTRAALRLEDGDLDFDRFTHLLHSSEAAATGDQRLAQQRADVQALVELLNELGDPFGASLGDSLGDSLASLSTATELRERLGAMSGGPADADLELPSDPPFIGRTLALTELNRGLDQAQIAQPTAILIQGQRGVGKSRLLSEFVAARLQANDAIVLTGAWQERSADSRGGLLSALEQLTHALAQLDPDERDDVRSRINRATRDLGAIVTRSAPSLGAVLRNVEELPPLELSEDFTRHTAVIADLFRAIGTQKRPLVLVLDNLEAVDAGSAAVIKVLAQHRPAHHSVIIMGMRTGTGFKPDFEHEPVELAPLSVIELEQLLTGALPGEVADPTALSEALWSVSGGLPLSAWTNLRAWLDRGRLSRGLDGVWRARGKLQSDAAARLEVYDVFGARLAEAPPAVRQVALRIAVLGAALSDDELRALEHDSELDSEPDGKLDIDQAVADLISRGILTRTQTGIRFPHDSIRELVFETFDEEHRRAAHRYAAELMVRQKAPVAQIVYHRDLALDPSASAQTFDKLSRLHIDAGRERLAVYDLERARWHLERALERSRDPDQRQTAAEGLADICLLSDDVDTAVSLYTAIIATSEPAHAVAAAAKSVAFLWSKSLSTEARQLGNMALEVVAEPIPTTPLGKFAAFVGAVFRSWFYKPTLAVETREALCRLYPWLTIISLVDDPVAVLMYAARGHWIAKGLESGAASIVRTIEGSTWSVLGFFDTANKIFASAEAIAIGANDPWALGWAKHHWAHISLLPSDRYEEGQDMLDDAIAAFRETGDVSISILSIMFKGLYGRDREHADVLLGWFDEATATAHRNGKFVATASLEALKLQVLARQGRTDLEPRMIALAGQLDADDMSGIERLMARVYLAFAAYESKAWNVAIEQVRAGQAQLGDLPGVPEYCSEIYLVTALVMLERPMSALNDRKLLRQSVRKFRAAAKHSQRLRVLGDFLELELALHAGDSAKARTVASKIVEGYEAHQNLYADRVAHRALARLLKGENVLAAAEHDRVARGLGRRLGLQERALLSDFADVEEEGRMLAITVDSVLKSDTQHDIPAAGMLTSAVQAKRRQSSPSPGTTETQTDVLEAWALDSSAAQHVVLGDIVAPVRDAVSGAIDAKMLTFVCPDPSLDVPVSSGDLEVILINLLLACSDAVGGSVPIEVRLESETVDGGRKVMFGGTGDGSAESSVLGPGRYLTIRVSAPSPTNRVPVLGAYSTCERLVQSVGGHLAATINRKKNTLIVRIPLTAAVAPQLGSLRRAIIVHADRSTTDSIGAVFDELGVEWRAFAPEEFDAEKLEHSVMLLLPPESIEAFAVFEPLFDLRIIEIIDHGAESSNFGGNTLWLPAAVADIEELLR